MINESWHGGNDGVICIIIVAIIFDASGVCSANVATTDVE